MKTCLLILLCLLAVSGRAVELKSPDGSLAVTFAVKDGAPVYAVAWKGKPLLAESRLGFELDGKPLDGLAIAGQQASRHNETWKPVYAERSSIRDHYNQVVIDLGKLRVTFRAYDEGVAFYCTLPKQAGMEQIHITRELTQFHFTGDYPAWAGYSAQCRYEKVPISKIKPGCERPLVVQAAEDCYVAIAEAKLVEYARMKLRPAKNATTTLEAFLDAERGKDGDVTGAAPLTTPWRVVMVADSPGRLLENNFILLNLNDPCALADTSWIKPGKVLREVTLTTVGGKACVDFAVKRGLQYILFDAGWYGHEYDKKSDARAVNLDPKRSKGPLDLNEVIRYGNEHGIGVLLYVNHLAAEQQLDEILPLYHKWGVKGVKYGFVNVGSQQWTSWLHMAIRKAAENKLMVDVHDEYRPTGYARTYPNLMTVEGILGDEEAKRTNDQSLTAQFTRFIAGPADNTICYYDARVDRLATHAYQLAKAVCFYSPLQHLFWYDRPPAVPQKTAGAGGGTPTIGDEPELEFFNHVPTVWDDTKVLQGKIGEYSLIARRSGAEWYIGFMNSAEPRSFDAPLAFLDAGRKYTAHIYSDDPAVPTRTHVKMERKPVEQGGVLSLTAGKNGGVAVRIAPSVSGHCHHHPATNEL